MHDTDLLFEAIDRLYDAATDVDKWQPFLATAGELFRSPRVLFTHHDVSDKKIGINAMHGYDWLMAQPDVVERIQRSADLAANIPTVAYSFSHPERPYHFGQMWDEDDMHASDFYKEVMVPNDNEYGMAVTWRDKTTLSAITFTRSAKEPPYTQDDCDLLGELVPHLKRAALLHRELAQHDFNRRVVLEVLEHIPLGIVIVDAGGGVRFVNGPAREMAGDGLLLNGDTLSATDADESNRMLQAVAAMVDNARKGTILPGQSMRLTRSDGKPALQVLVSTLWGNHVKWGTGLMDEPLAVLFITDPLIPQETPQELLQRLFGLTAAEARITEHLVAGLNAEDTAKALGLSKETVRSTMKIIYGKCDVTTQTQLVNVVKSTPVWMRVEKN